MGIKVSEMSNDGTPTVDDQLYGIDTTTGDSKNWVLGDVLDVMLARTQTWVGANIFAANLTINRGGTLPSFFMKRETNVQNRDLFNLVGVGQNVSAATIEYGKFIINQHVVIDGAESGRFYVQLREAGTPDVIFLTITADTNTVSIGNGANLALAVLNGVAIADYLISGGALGIPSSGDLQNCTALPTSALTGILADARMPNLTGNVTTVEGAVSTTIVSCPTSALTGIIADARMPNLTGDITTSEGAVATTIVSSAVVTGMINNNAVTLNKMTHATVQGSLITYNTTSETPSFLTPGTEAQVLTAHGTANLTWEDASAGLTQEEVEGIAMVLGC